MPGGLPFDSLKFKDYLKSALQYLSKFKKLTFIHFAFFIQSQQFFIVPQGGQDIRHTIELYVFDDYGNCYLIQPESYGNLAIKKFKMAREPDEDDIIYRYRPLSNSIKTFIKSTIPVFLGISYQSTSPIPPSKFGIFGEPPSAFLNNFMFQIRLLA